MVTINRASRALDARSSTPWWASRSLHLIVISVVFCAYALFVTFFYATDDNIASLRSVSPLPSSSRSAASAISSSHSHVPQKWNSAKSVVIGLASGYNLDVYKRFVGSLRATGFNGHIILGISSDPPQDVTDYLQQQNVTTKPVDIGRCTYYNATMENGKPLLNQKCATSYPQYKIQWGRFPMAKDWLLDCEECTNGVMLTDTRDAYFQSDPFAYVDNPKSIMVFEEIFPNLTASHWLAHNTVSRCRKTQLLRNESLPMLCSGSTMGSREGILQYVNAMVEEFDYWNSYDNCRSDMVGDDQSIHNYLYYANKLPGAVAVPHRTGAIHVVGFQANVIFRKAIVDAEEDMSEEEKGSMNAEDWVNRNGFRVGTNKPQTNVDDEDNAWRDWLGKPSLGTDLADPKTGLILNFDGRPSPQVHQFDRFGHYINKFFDNMDEKEWSKSNF